MFADNLLDCVAARRISAWQHMPEDEEEIIVHVLLALMPLVENTEPLELAPQFIERSDEGAGVLRPAHGHGDFAAQGKGSGERMLFRAGEPVVAGRIETAEAHRPIRLRTSTQMAKQTVKVDARCRAAEPPEVFVADACPEARAFESDDGAVNLLHRVRLEVAAEMFRQDGLEQANLLREGRRLRTVVADQCELHVRALKSVQGYSTCCIAALFYHRGMELVITLLVVGVILLSLETLLPGMIAGVIGLLCLAAGVIAAFVTFGPQTGFYVFASVTVLVIVGTLIWVKVFPSTRMARQFTSDKTSGDIGTDRPELLNQTGTALTRLRPSGTALINDRRVDVVTEGVMIERDTPIKVVAVEGMRVVVAAISDKPVS